MTAARAAEQDRGEGVLHLPEARLLPSRQLEQLAAERDRLLAWLRADLAAGGSVREIGDLVHAVSPARRTVAARGLGPAGTLLVQEIGRYADRALWLAVEAARERGELIRSGDNRRGAVTRHDRTLRMLEDYGLTADDTSTTAALARGVSDERFDQAIARGKRDGNLSRAYLKELLTDAGSRDQLGRIGELAAAGHTSGQIADQLGMRERQVRLHARRHGIEIPADRVVHKTHRAVLDPERIVGQTVTTLDGLRQGLEFLTPEDLDGLPPEQLRHWLGSLTASLRALKTLTKELNDRVH